MAATLGRWGFELCILQRRQRYKNFFLGQNSELGGSCPPHGGD